MAKTKTDLDHTAHQQGDGDGLGMFRGAFCAFGIEVAVAVVYGLVLLLTHPAASAIQR